MNHRSYEDWLFASYDDDEQLPAQQAADLQAHLQDCETCRSLAAAWEQVETELRQAPLLAPQPGFALRWQANLEADRQRMHQRQTAAALLITSFGVAALVILILALLWPWVRTPGVFVWVWLYRLITMLSYADALRGLLSATLQAASGAVSLAGGLLFAGLLSELAVLWVVSYRLLTNPRRITR
ncbi:MAG: hypothetical protein JXA78_11345 [Anaerolineales bacterium]|nr:hypothetical protein [Anaerolineales bacterium]